MAREQRCPEVERLQVLIKDLKSQDIAVVDTAVADIEQEKHVEITGALEWLKDFLLARRLYQRKQQIKKKIMAKIITEHDLSSALDETIKAQYGADLERFDDVQQDEE